ncbi:MULTISPECIES: thiazole synthase [Rhizobium]|uniref:Thiazole synthase n=1 Tax=Rhizobium tropici TaxID=398 RepID=A0A6P1C244_RHITR|nr:MULTISPECIES: thiazole synthase [Rhizobium]AGB74488.1 thiazole biosynthesis protein ThiG [Rhizobium tropici CIAT 899]MBB4242774.1 thiazole synthase [Rhizobium tropici]MBB5594321.1 thiazole synthase [Rhizobium tropici]MBB6493099.1 thiazole synthase [Rhizobium tropici]NEV10757.1 thiazole synthase [Rhizobium tropici]
MLELYGTQITSRLLLGTARYPSPAVLAEAVKRSQTGIVTVSLRRETAGGRNGGAFFEMIRELGVRVLPNTAGCHGVSEAVLTAKMAREVFRTNWIKLEVIGNHDTLQPDVFALVEAAKILTNDGFEVFPYTTDDLIVAERLLEAGCKVLMPWCAPIGTAAGPLNLSALRSMRAHFPEVPLVVDAGIGRPSHATTVMELGFDAVLLNTAVAGAGDPAAMAEAFAKAIDAGRQAYGAGMLEPRDMAVPSTPVIGKAVFA